MKDTTSLARAKCLRILQVSPVFGMGGKAMKVAPSRICEWISHEILKRLAEDKPIRFPGLGLFYSQQLKVKLPKDVRTDVYGEPIWETDEREVTVIRFRPFESAKKRLKRLIEEGA